MTTALLWTLAIIGAWNGANMAARLIFREPIWWRYLWSVILGAWAALALWLR
jgi:hypothetical protein